MSVLTGEPVFVPTGELVSVPTGEYVKETRHAGLIQIRGLTKRYGDRLALDDVSFDVRSGEVVGLLGLNGAGKTTIMKIVAGYVGATSGSVSICGYDISWEPRAAKRAIGYLPEQLAFYDEMRVCEYLDFVCNLKGVRTARKDHLHRICEKVGISAVSRRLIRNLSKGYRQRLGFAQALVGDPQVLILDEPTSGLDPSQAIGMRSLIEDVAKRSAVLISSHILTEIQAISTRVLVLHNGRLLADNALEKLNGTPPHRVVARIQGEPAQVRRALDKLGMPASIKVLAQREPDAYDYLVEAAEARDIRTELFRALAQADLPLLDSQSPDNSLERVFLQLVAEAR